MSTPLTVEIGDSHVAIYDQIDLEVVRWVEEEWIEDPSIVPAIVNAVHLAYTDPHAFNTILPLPE